MRSLLLCSTLLFTGLACDTPDSTSPSPEDNLPPPGPGHATADRPVMTPEACERQGKVVGDPGDGSTHRPDYLCSDTGEPPIGAVLSGIEGAVCCASPYDLLPTVDRPPEAGG